MTFLIRKLVANQGSRKSYQDFEVASTRLTIGRGTDQDLLLPGDRVSLRHAEINLLGGLIQLNSSAPLGVVVNGRTCQSASLKIGDQLLIGDYHLVLIAPPDDDIECAITVQQLQPQEYEGLDPSDYKTFLRHVPWLSKRTIGWSLFVLMILIGLGLPVLFNQLPALRDASPVALPDDSVWLSGPLHREHRFIGDDCQACHTEPFEPVQDSACVGCHKDVSQHVPDAHPANSLFGTQNCASCHHEHNEQQRMVMEDQRFCASCHRVLASVMGPRGQVSNASDFSHDHPDFRLSLLQPTLQDGDWQWLQTGRQARTEQLKEINHLRFDHQQHLAKEGMKNESGAYEVLECSSCHIPAADGFGMVPITMENACGRCHSLSFDLANPARQVPHAPPEQVIESLREYFSTRFVQERLGGSAPTSIRRPGNAAPTPRLQQEGLAWVEARTRETAEDMFERRACVTCHEVDTLEENGVKRWQVRPNRINQHWFMASPFPHYKHRNESCASCHAAEQSTQTADILMPHIEACQDCHGGPDTEDRVLSMCVTCHRYHQPGTELMVESP